jgi:hypothetical protein
VLLQIASIDTLSKAKDPVSIDKMLLNHILALRQVPKYATAVIMVGIEQNYGGAPVANRTASILKPNKKDTALSQYQQNLTGGRSLGTLYIYNKSEIDSHLEAGVWTGHEQKVGGAESLLETMRRGALRFAEDFVCQTDPGQMKRKFCNQLANFRKISKPLLHPEYQEPTIVLTGKAGGKQDDIVVCVQLNKYWREVVQRLWKFKQLCLALGLRSW